MDAEKVAMTGISQGRLFLFIMDLSDEDCIIKKALNLGLSDSSFIHSIEVAEDKVYMADSYNNKIYRYDLAANEVDETNAGKDPRHMCMDKENLYVANFETDNISIIDLNTFTMTGSIPAGIKAHDVIYSENSRTLYTSCYEENEVVEYTIDKGLRRSIKTVGKPMHLALLNKTILVLTYYVNGIVQTYINFIDLIDKKTENILVINGLCSDFLLDKEGHMLYIINIVDKSLYLADASIPKVVKTMYLGGYPESISSGLNHIYVTNSKKQQIKVIDKRDHTSRTLDLDFVPDLIKVYH